MKQFVQTSIRLVLTVALLPGCTIAVLAQTGSVIPVPMVTAYAGITTGGSACTTSLPNSSGQLTGDGCLPTQAYITAPLDTQVDAAGNVYISEDGASTNPGLTGNVYDIRMVYNSGATAASVLTAANAGIANFTPVQGRIYTLAGGETGSLASHNSAYYCGNNYPNGQLAFDSGGNGCPATQAYIKPAGVFVDQYGNIFAVNLGSGINIRVIYAGGTQIANLITLMNPGVTPQVGYIYVVAGSTSAGYSGDGGLANAAKFVSPRFITVSGKGDIFVSDEATLANGATSMAAANNIRKIDGTTGIITTVAGETTCVYTTTAPGCPFGYSGDDGPATSAVLDAPMTLFLDQYDNLYFADRYNLRVRVVYYAGSIPGVASPVVGNIYTYAGGGTGTANGTAARQASIATLTSVGIDHMGNIYVQDSGSGRRFWRFDAVTGIGNLIAGNIASGSVAGKGSFCAGTSGPVSTNSIGDGCPGPQTYITVAGTVAFDSANNMYVADSSNFLIHRLSLNNQFGSTSDGTPVTQPLAFQAVSAITLTGESFTLQSAATAELSDAGGDTCTTTATLAAKAICVFYVKFNPAHAGLRAGTLQFNTTSGIAGSENLSGIGLASDEAIDTGTQSTLGTGLSPAGVAADLLGNVFVSDTTGNRVLRGPSTGTTLTSVITGLSAPTAIALDGSGNIYVADTGNNRVLQTTATGTPITSLGTGLSGPKGVAVDGLGDIYVADTGNNRIVQLATNGVQAILPITGLSAPTQLSVDASGNLFILDSGNKRIEKYTAGSGLTTVTLDASVIPAGMAIDAAGDVYVADSSSLNVLVYTPGAITGDLLLSGLKTPVGLAADADANLFIADTQAGGLIQLRRSLGNVSFQFTNLLSTTTESIILSNVGNAALNFPLAPLTTVTGSPYFTVVSSTTNGCGLGTSYAPGSNCNLTANFKPLTVGTYTASVVFNTNASNTSTAVANLTGLGLQLTSTNVALTVVSPIGAIDYGQPVTVSIALTPSTTTTQPTGTFTLTLNGHIQTPQSIGNGTITLTVNPAVGPYTISATYSGDMTYASSADTLNLTINKAPTTTLLTAIPANSAGLMSLLFTSTVTSTTASGATGTVTFYAGNIAIGGPVAINNVGVATYSSSSFSFANNNFTAVYSGDTNFSTSTSSVVPPATGDFAVGPDALSFSTPQGGAGNLGITLQALYGSTGTITPSCSGLPANSLCRFSVNGFNANTITLGSASVSVLVQVYTNVSSTLARNEMLSRGRFMVLSAGLLPVVLLFIRRRAKLRLLVMLLAGFVLIGTLSGCSSASVPTNAGLVTPAGNYPLIITFTGSNGLTSTHVVNVSFTVITQNGPV